jgi:hypothetical protein
MRLPLSSSYTPGDSTAPQIYTNRVSEGLFSDAIPSVSKAVSSCSTADSSSAASFLLPHPFTANRHPSITIKYILFFI